MLKVGDIVMISGHEDLGYRTVEEVLNQKIYPGGVRLNRIASMYDLSQPIEAALTWWNEDALICIWEAIWEA